MILQALYSYYERKFAEGNSGIPPFGLSMEKISFALVLSDHGVLQDIEDLRIEREGRLWPRSLMVPAPVKKASGIAPNFLWDSTSYVLGIDDKGKPKRTASCHATFVELVRRYSDADDPDFNAILRFFDQMDADKIRNRPDWSDISGSNLVFRRDGIPGFVHDRPPVRGALDTYLSDQESSIVGQCLITGQSNAPIARLHPSIKGVRGAQPSGASIVSFNKESFASYRKTKSFNAPVSTVATFNYTTALNALLSEASTQKILVGDTTVLFWAEKQFDFEYLPIKFVDPPDPKKVVGESQDDPFTAAKIHDMLSALRDGKSISDVISSSDSNVKFFVLGLSPNAARISIRFWEVNTLGSLLQNSAEHFKHLHIVRKNDDEHQFPPVKELLFGTVRRDKKSRKATKPGSEIKNISPQLSGALLNSILTGRPYPENLLQTVVTRVRAEQDITYYQAALLKAFLVRNRNREITYMLDEQRTDYGYRLGRLFSIIEKAQQDAIPGTKATIKDRFLGSASSTPRTVFPYLLRNVSHHIAKIRKEPNKQQWAISLEKKIQDIMWELKEIPTTLTLEEQANFMIGYYHQRKDLYTKKHD